MNSLSRSALLAAAWLCACGSPRAQLTHRGTAGFDSLTQSVQYLDTWEQGGTMLGRGPRDVLSRIERRSSTGSSVMVDLLLYGPWGHHLYSFEESARVTDGPKVIVRTTTWRAIDMNGDALKELVFIERSASVMTLLPDDGDPAKDTGPFFDDLTVRVRWLERTADALLEHELDGDPEAELFTTLTSHELGGGVNAALQLLAGDWLFNAGQFEKARYRYQLAREWAERSLPGRDVAHLDVGMPLLQVDTDEPAFTWIQSVRRVGSLPPWYQRH